jgi:hypothetical protein
MDRLPNTEVDVHYSPSLGRIGIAGNGNVEAISPALCCDESTAAQKGLQVANETWCINEDVHAAKGELRSCRNGVAFSHCRQKPGRVKRESQENGSQTLVRKVMRA